MARELTNVKVSKLSLVFRPANGDAIRVMKSEAQAQERPADRKAISTTILKGYKKPMREKAQPTSSKAAQNGASKLAAASNALRHFRR